MGEIRGSPYHPPAKLPSRLTPFVGREAELANARQLVEDPSIRLITILGIGGIGKTALALELARSVADRFEHGAAFLPLSQLNSVDELLPALAQGLDIQLPPSGDLQQVVLDHLAPQHVLLVLDGFEHLLSEAILLRDILVAAPRVKILVTSREKLNLEAETPYLLGGVELPTSEAGQDAKDAQEFDSVRLFLQRAHQARPGFSLDAHTRPAVVRLCRLVDGTPLGILLAAAWVEHFSPDEIAAETASSLDFLTRSLRDADPRHSGLRAVFESSFKRLDPSQRQIFLKLSVMRGGFDLAAAEAVAGADVGGLISLAEKSMLTRNPDTGRYEIHGVLRQYAREALAASGERDRVLDAHAAYFRDFVQKREARIMSGSQTAALDEIQADFDNVRQAFDRAVTKREFESVRVMLPGSYAYCDMRSRFYEGEALFRQAAKSLAPQGAERPDGVWALVLLSWFDMRNYFEHFESYEEITSRARSCLEQSRTVQDQLGIAASLVLLGAISTHQDDFKSSIRYCEEAIRVFPALDDFYWVNMRIGLAYESDGRYQEAIRAFEVCLARGRRTGERVKAGWSLQNMGDTLVLEGKPGEARSHLEQALVNFQQVGTRIGVIWANYSLSRLAMSSGDRLRALELARTAAQRAHEVHSPSWIAKTDALLKELEPEAGSPPTAVRPEDNSFSQRELEVLQLLKSDLSGPEIAQRLVVSLNTVRFHTKHIYQKLGVNSRLEAIQGAKKRGL